MREFGLVEGSSNQHPGQGTACRRFFFRNAMIEFLWVEDVVEIQSDQTQRTKLWERWSGAGLVTSPFGIVLRPTAGTREACPFASWEYSPASMPGLTLHIAEGAGLEEPMWCYMAAGRAVREVPAERREPLEHPASLRDITAVRIVCPFLRKTSLTVAMTDEGVISLGTGPEHLLELQFDGGRQAKRMDFRPDLPLAFCW